MPDSARSAPRLSAVHNTLPPLPMRNEFRALSGTAPAAALEDPQRPLQSVQGRWRSCSSSLLLLVGRRRFGHGWSAGSGLQTCDSHWLLSPPLVTPSSTKASSDRPASAEQLAREVRAARSAFLAVAPALPPVGPGPRWPPSSIVSSGLPIRSTGPRIASGPSVPPPPPPTAAAGATGVDQAFVELGQGQCSATSPW